MSVDVAEVTDNLRAMLRMNAARFAVMVERQVQFALLPRLRGPRAALEPDLCRLLVLLIEGPDASTPSLTDDEVQAWLTCADAGLNRAGSAQAAFPKAAGAVASVLRDLREHGALPVPTLRSGEQAG